MAREILARVPMPDDRAAVLDLICYRALLRVIPKLRGLGVVGLSQFRRRLGMGEDSGRAALRWLASLSLARAPAGTGMAWEIPEAVVEVCLQLKEARGKEWWKEATRPPRPAPYKRAGEPRGPMSAETRAKISASNRRRWAERKATS